MKKIISAVAIVCISLQLQAQQSPAQKAISNPARKQQEAKAEKLVSDSLRRQVTPAPTKPADKKKCNSKSCCKKKSS